MFTTKCKGVGLKRVFLGSVLIVIIVLFVGTSFAGEKLDKVRIGLGTRFYGPLLPIYVAQSLNFYERFGIKAEIAGYKGGGASMEAIVAGEADFICYFPPGVAQAYTKGAKALIVAAGMARPMGWWIMVKKNSPIKNLKDLEGKKMGITSHGSTTDFFAKWALNKAKVNADLIPVGGGGMAAHIITGGLDAISVFPALSYRLLLEGEARILMDLGKEMPPNYPDVWVASQQMVDERPDVLRRLVKVLFFTIRYMKQNPDFSINFIKVYNNYSLDVAKYEYEHTIKKLSDDGMIKKEWLNNSFELAKLAGITDLPPLEKIYTQKFVPVKFD